MPADDLVLPIIDREKCDGCGLCVPACPANALAVEGGKVKLTLTDCEYCGECEAACPIQAIACPYEIVWQ